MVDANDRPWSCLRDEHPHELESTTGCSTCVRWESRPDARSQSPNVTIRDDGPDL